MSDETPEQKQIRRWLEGVKRYAGRKGYEISVKARELGNLTAAAPAALGEKKVAAIEKIGEAAFVNELEKMAKITGLSREKILSAVSKRYDSVMNRIPKYKTLLKSMKGTSEAEVRMANLEGPESERWALKSAIERIPKMNPKHSILF